MFKSFSFWIKTAIAFQLLTGLIHALSFLVGPQASSPEEAKMIELMTTLKTNLGAGFTPTTMDFFLALSSCFSFLYLLGGLINIQLLRINLPESGFKGVLNISVLIYGSSFIIMFFLTFLFPVILTGLTFLTLLIARLTIKTE